MYLNKASLRTGAVVCAMISGLGFSAAVQAGKGYCGYVTSSTGELVRDSDGHCVYNSSWTPALAIEQCDPDLVKKKAKPKPEPKPALVPTPVKPSPPPPAEPVFKTIELKAGALFDTNSAELKPAGRKALDELAARLRDVSQYGNFQVIGHTDRRGSARYNQLLSERRAQAVRNYLVGKGIDAARIQVIGRGESNPIADNATAEGRARNRRVEIRVKVTRRVQ